MPPYDFINLPLYIVLRKKFKGYLVKNRSLRGRLSEVHQSLVIEEPRILMSRMIGFRKLCDLSLHIFPHMAVEFKRKLAEWAGEGSPFSKFGYGIVSRAPANGACKGERFLFHGLSFSVSITRSRPLLPAGDSRTG